MECFPHFLSRQNDGAGTAGGSLFRGISGIIEDSEKKGGPPYAKIGDGDAHPASERDN